jgi:PmbA protein
VLSNHYLYRKMLNDPSAREKLGVDPADHRDALAPRNGFRISWEGGRSFQSPPGVATTNIVVDPGDESRAELLQRIGDGVYIGRIWYTYPVNGLNAGDFTATVVGDSFLIEGGRLGAPLKPNTVRIDDNIRPVLRNILGLSRDRKPAVLWGSLETAFYVPAVAVEGVRLSQIGEFLETSP